MYFINFENFNTSLIEPNYFVSQSRKNYFSINIKQDQLNILF